MARRFLICLAFATCCFLNSWVEYAEGNIAYFVRQDPTRAVAIPIVSLEIVLALGMFGLWELLRWRHLENALPLHFLFLALCFLPLGGASVALLRALPFPAAMMVRKTWFWPVVLTAGVVPLGFVCRRPRRASRLMRSALLYSWPILILVTVQACRGTLLKYPHQAYADGALAIPLPSRPAQTRVVWIVFDELSQTIAYGNRPSDLTLPNFDRLKEGSFYASTAEPPAEWTETSMPSLILGEPVLEVNPRAPDDLRVRTASHAEWLSWSSIPNVFDDARDLGFNTALVGWYHPYGRLLSRCLTRCYWTAGGQPAGTEEPSQSQPLVPAIWNRLRLEFSALPLIGRLPRLSPARYPRREKIEQFSWLRDRALEVVRDPGIGLALIHLPIPHPPAIYDKTNGLFTDQGGIGYIDSVALADRTLGELRHAMEQTGLWDSTALLVSADHGWRTPLWRGDPEWTPGDEAASHQNTSGVPFLLKLPGQTSGVVYGKPFNTIVTRQLIANILNGQLTKPGEVPLFIDTCPALHRHL